MLWDTTSTLCLRACRSSTKGQTLTVCIPTPNLGFLQAPLSDILCSPHVYWQYQPENLDILSKVDCLYEKDDRDFQPPCTFGKLHRDLYVDFSNAFGDQEIVQIQAQNGLLSWLYDHPTYAGQLNALGLTVDNAYGCLSNFIFQASPSLQKQLPASVLQAMATGPVIGIQIRCACYPQLLHIPTLPFFIKYHSEQTTLSAGMSHALFMHHVCFKT